VHEVELRDLLFCLTPQEPPKEGSIHSFRNAFSSFLYLGFNFPYRVVIIPMAQESYFILYVADQGRSRAFYSTVLERPPRLDVPGMTEFSLPGGGVLGLMPVAGIRKLLGPALPDPSAAQGIPRAELYLLADEPGAFHARALSAGAQELSPLLLRSWGHQAAYSLDPDGHVLAFASQPDESSAAP
jgi:catechol 2,3-dioxygenase-like lactoylglutathione lyase family enzyme